MIKYYELMGKKKQVAHETKQEKRRLHNLFVSKNKNVFKWMDIFVLVIILMNFGALAITNVLVVRTTVADPTKDLQFREVNPTVAKSNNFEVHPNAVAIISSLLRQAIIWIISLAIYIYYRRNVFTEEGLTVMIFLVGYYFLIIGLDFFNDFGYLIGNFMFGG